MAKTATKRPSSFYELILTGPEELAHGFLAGLTIGAGHDAFVIHEPDEEIAGPSFKEKLMQAIHVHGHETCVVVDNTTRSLVKKNAKKMFAETGLHLSSDRKVRGARFEFNYQAFAPRYGKEILAILEALPRGLKMSNHKSKVTLDPSAKGPEGYTPTHDYEIKGSGEIHGRFDTVMDLRRLLDTHPLVNVSMLDLDLT
jgi:hypothetical protein